MADVFISYSRKDRGFVRKLHDALAKLNRDTWVDWEDIPLSAAWLQEIYAGIDAADNFVFVISPESVDSTTCQQEISRAATNKKRLIPILHRDVPNKKIPEAVAPINWISFRDSDDFESTFASVIDALDTDLDWKRAHTRLLVRAKEWKSKNQDESFLLRGMELQDARNWLAQAPTIKLQEPTSLQLEYIKVSQKWEAGELERAQRQARRLRRLSWALGVFLLLATGAALYASWQRTMANAQELVAASSVWQEADPELSVLIAAHSVAATWWWGHTVLPEAQEQLRRSLNASRVMLTLRGHPSPFLGDPKGSPVDSVAWSPDGKRLATGSWDRTVKVWDACSGRELLTLTGHTNFVWSVAWTRDGQRLATSSNDGTAKVWEAERGKELRTLRAHRSPVRSIAWSPDGKRLATGSEENTTKVWDTRDGRELVTLAGRIRSGAVWDVDQSPDGKELATASGNRVTLWDSRSDKEIVTLAGHHDDVLGVAWSPDGKWVATGSQDHTGQDLGRGKRR